MRIFVTGASGWIGSAVTAELLAHQHQVVGLARSDRAAEAVAATGAEVVRGDIQDLDVLRAAAGDSEGVVHLAFRHDVAFGQGDFDTAVNSNQVAIEAFGEVLAGTDRPLVIASGVAGLSQDGEVATEEARPEPFPGAGGRIANERTALALAEQGVRAMSARFAPTVHGDGDGGFIKQIVEGDRAHGRAGYVGDGAARWSAVHRSDAARLVRLGVEHAPAGSVLHAVAEEGVAMRDIAEAIARGLGVPTESLTAEQAEEQFGPIGRFVALDLPASSAITRRLLDWTPSGPTLVADIEQGHYFQERAAKY